MYLIISINCYSKRERNLVPGRYKAYFLKFKSNLLKFSFTLVQKPFSLKGKFFAQ